MNAPTHLTTKQLAARWALHHESVRRMFREGRLPGIKLGRQIRIPISDVERIEAENRRAGGYAS